MSVPSESPKPKRRWWRWLKRLMLAGAVLLVLAVVFYQPLLRFMLRYGGPLGANYAGVKLNWQVDGSVLGDLRLSQIEASGMMIEKATIGELSASYDARRAIRTGEIDVIKRVTVKDVEAVVDLRKQAKTEARPAAPKPASARPPPLVWPEVIDIENVNAVITLADGRVLTVRGLTLRVGEGMPGVFECAEFKMEPGDVRITDVKAGVRWTRRELAITNLDLPYGAKLGSLAVDLREWENDAASVKMEAGIGKAALNLEAAAKGLFGGAMQTKADVRVSNFTSNDWKMPDGVTFGPVNAEVHAEGDPAKAMSLLVNGKANVTDIRAAGALLDSVAVVFEAKDGIAKVSEAKVLRGSNEVAASVEAKLADDLMKSPWAAKMTARITDVTQLLEKPPPAKGVVAVEAMAEGVGTTPTKAAAQVNGSDLGFESYKLPKLAMDVSLDGKAAKVSVPALMLGDGNRIDVNASMLMEDTMPVTADWNVQIDDPALLLKTVNLPPLQQPVTAKLRLTGKTALRVNDPLNAESQVDLTVKDGRFGDAALPAVELQALTAKGKAVLESCRVVVDERNRIDLKGSAALQEPWSFETSGAVELPELKALNPLLAAFKAPAVEGGGVMAKLNMRGDAKPWRGEGTVSMQAVKVKVAGMPEAADMDLKTSFAGTMATIESLQAILGPWKLATKGAVTDKRADLSELNFWQNERKIMSGHARAAFDLSQVEAQLDAKDLPLHEVAAAAGIKNVPQAVFSSAIAVQSLEDASITVSLRDVKAPNMPKSFQPAQVNVSTVLKGGKLVVDAKVEQKPLQPLVLKAEVPVVVAEVMKKPEAAMNLPLKGTLEMAESDLSFARDFAPQMIRSVPARMKLNVKVGGTVKAPLIDSVVDVNVQEVGFVSADMPSVRDVKVRVSSHDRKATIEEISALLAGGRVRLSGGIDATQVENPRFDLKLMAREALVFRDPTSSLRANADLSCAGTLKAARVSGLVEAVRGRIFREVDLLPNVTGMIQQGEKLPPPPPSTGRSVQKVELPPLLKDWSFDLAVRTRDPVLLAGNLVNGAISADVKLGGTGAKPLLTGFANVDRLLLKLPFSLLKITKGVVTMNPENPFAPKLDVRGESRIGSYDISLYVYGDATNPKTRFTSTPPLSEADIVTLLGTGMTLGGDNSQMASEAMTRAAFLVISETWRKIFNKEKKIREEPPKLHVTFNPSGGDRANDSMQATYELTPKVRFTGKFMQSGRMKALLGYVLRFGKAARAMDEEGGENDE